MPSVRNMAVVATMLAAIAMCSDALAAKKKKKKHKPVEPAVVAPLEAPPKKEDVELAAPAPKPKPELAAPAASKKGTKELEGVLEPVPSMKAAEQLYQNAEFAQSILVLDKLLRTDIDLSTKKQARLFMALNFLALGNEPRAKSALQDLLDLDPDFTLPTFSSPSVRSFFQTVKSTYKIIPLIDHNPPPKIDATSGVDLQVKLERMRKGYQPKLFFRAKGTPYFSNIDLTQQSGASYSATIPPAMLVKPEGYTLEYFIVVTEGTDTTLVQLRDPQSPFSVPVDVPVAPPEALPVHKRWYFWVALGGAVLVAGGVTATVVLTRPQTQPYGDANVVFRF